MASTALSRPVYTAFWIRPDVNEDYTCDDKLLYVYLTTNQHFLQHAIYKLSKKMMMVELNMPEDRFNKAFDRLENEFKVIKYSERTREIAILDYLEYGLISSGAALTNLYDNLGRKVDDLELLKCVYEKAMLILDDRDEVHYARDRMRELLASQNMLVEESEDVIEVTTEEDSTTKKYKPGSQYPDMANTQINEGYFDSRGIFWENNPNELPF